jgi:predicted nucleotide-binding protein
MSAMPSRSPKVQQPAGQPVLRVTLTEAQDKLSERMAAGSKLASVLPTTVADMSTLGHTVDQWGDYNRTWLDKFIGGEAADEYKTVSLRMYSYDSIRDPSARLRSIQTQVQKEMSKLQSIYDRLEIWIPAAAVDAADDIEATNQNVDQDSEIAADRKAVMVIYGHDQEANDALFSWLRAIGLKPREWSQLVSASGDASPYIGQVLEQAFRDAQAVIAFFTPDEFVLAKDADPMNKASWRLQARPNVLIEAGMALVTHPRRTVLVVHGAQELPSDLAGRHYIRLSSTSPSSLHTLATRLHDAGCETDQSGTDWLNASRFPDRDSIPIPLFIN